MFFDCNKKKTKQIKFDLQIDLLSRDRIFDLQIELVYSDGIFSICLIIVLLSWY